MNSPRKIYESWIGRSYKNLVVLVTLGKSSRCCYNCRRKFRHFTKFRGGFSQLNSWLMSLDMVGSDIDNFGCPYCGVNDRVRHLLMYFDRLNMWKYFQHAAVLHFAPEEHLVKRIKSMQPGKYILADLVPTDPSIQQIDITDIPFDENEFDIVISNHVLEHVRDYKKALREIARILRPGGFAILQTPYSRKLTENFEDDSINTDELRLQFYGQEDHVRWFSERQLIDDFIYAGLTPDRKKHGDYFTNNEHTKFGVNPEEDLLLVTKENN